MCLLTGFCDFSEEVCQRADAPHGMSVPEQDRPGGCHWTPPPARQTLRPEAQTQVRHTEGGTPTEM